MVMVERAVRDGKRRRNRFWNEGAEASTFPRHVIQALLVSSALSLETHPRLKILDSFDSFLPPHIKHFPTTTKKGHHRNNVFRKTLHLPGMYQTLLLQNGRI
jgi:hypothetical protein